MREILHHIDARVRRLLFVEYATSYTALGIFRITYALTFVVLLGIPQFEHLGALPDFLYNPPPGLARLFSGFPGPGTIQIFDILITVSFFAILIGWQTRTASYILGFSMLICKSWAYSLGKTDHDLLVWLVPIFLGWHWGRGVSVDALAGKYDGSRTISWPVTFYALFMAFGFFSAAVPKILGGWLDPTHSMFEAFVQSKTYAAGSPDKFLIPLTRMHIPVLWEMFDWLAIAFEAGFLIAFLRAPVFRVFTVIAMCFHTFVLLTLDISFTSYLSVYPLFWIPLVAGAGRSMPVKRIVVILGIVALPVLILQFMGYDFTIRGAWEGHRSFNLCMLSLYTIAGMTIIGTSILRRKLVSS